MELNEFIEKYGNQLANCIDEKLTPIYNPTKPQGVEEYEKRIEGLIRKPFPVQAEIIKGVSKSLYKKNCRNQFIVGEMGTGKTMLSLSVIAMYPKPQRTIVVCPTHLVKKWIRETKETIPDVITVDLTVKNVITILDALRSNRKKKPQKHEVFVISKERAKLSYGWRGAALSKNDSKIPHCPKCGTAIVDSKDNYLTFSLLNKKRYTCSCGEPLWQATSKIRRYAPAEYIKKYLKGFFDLLVIDEVHDFKAGDSLQGRAMGMLLISIQRCLCLTGTLNGGYADDLFYLLFRMNPAALKKDGFEYRSSTKWQEAYGVLEEVKNIEEEDNYYGRGRKNGKIVRRRPGVSPLIVGKHLLDKSSFIKLSDVADSLPPYEETVLSVRMNEEQAAWYNSLQRMLKEAVREYKNKALASMLQALLSYPDSCCFFPEYIEIKDKQTEEVLEVIEAPKIECSGLLPKEVELVSLAKKQKYLGRKTLCYLTFTNSRDIRPRLKDVLENAGLRVGILDVSVEPKKREAWIEKHSKDIDVLLVNAELVKTGLDLYSFPTIVFYQTGYNIFTVRQAARRSWRIGQTQPVKVYFLCYQQTMQEIALYLVAEKLETALMIEGDIPEGLADYSNSGASVFEELGKALTEGSNYSGAEEKWARFRKKEVESQIEIGSQSAISEPKVQLDNNIIVRISLKKGRRKKWSTLEVKRGDLDSGKFQGKPLQFAFPF